MDVKRAHQNESSGAHGMFAPSTSPGLMAAFGMHLIKNQVNTLMKTSQCNEEKHGRALHLASFALRMG